MPTAAELRDRLVRNVDDLSLERFERAPLYDSRSASVTDGTAARKLGAGYDVVPAGKRTCPYHLHHAQEEMFVILEGAGTLRVAGENVPVRAGDVVVIPPGPDYPHQFINTSDAPMRYLSISTRDEPEICEYPDSGKFSAFTRSFRGANRAGASLDYWDGEP